MDTNKNYIWTQIKQINTNMDTNKKHKSLGRDRSRYF